MIFFFIILLLKNREHEIPKDIGKTIKLIPVTDKVIEVDVAPMTTILCTDSRIVFGFLKIL